MVGTHGYARSVFYNKVSERARGDRAGGVHPSNPEAPTPTAKGTTPHLAKTRKTKNNKKKTLQARGLRTQA